MHTPLPNSPEPKPALLAAKRGADVAIGDADRLPRWQRPETLLMLMAIASPLAFATWMALLNNFVVERAAFEGARAQRFGLRRGEIPGFLAFLVIWILLIMREQVLAYSALILLGLGTAITGELPTFWGLMFTTIRVLGLSWSQCVVWARASR